MQQISHSPSRYRVYLLAVLFACACFFCIAPGNALAYKGDAPALPGLPALPTLEEIPFLPVALGGVDRHGAGPRESISGSPAEEMLAGSFLGALLFGIPYEGIGAADIIVLALLGFLTARALTTRRGSDGDRFDAQSRNTTLRFPEREREDGQNEGQQTNAPRNSTPGNNARDNAWTRKLGGRGPADESGPYSGRAGQAPQMPQRMRPTNVQENAAAMWAALSGSPAPVEEADVADGVVIPAGFDVNDFLAGARALYVKLQTAWAARQLESLIPFTTKEMMLLLQKQAVKNPEPSTVDILLVNATLEGVSGNAGEETATVLFHVTMRFGDKPEADVVSELWHFVRGSETDGGWRLSGIDAA